MKGFMRILDNKNPNDFSKLIEKICFVPLTHHCFKVFLLLYIIRVNEIIVFVKNINKLNLS